jgi:hypothetical protein
VPPWRAAPHFFREFKDLMAHNVPAVYDGFLCPIREMRSISKAQKTVGGVSRGSGA